LTSLPRLTSICARTGRESISRPGPGWQVEHRYRAVMEVLDGSPVSEAAVRYGVSRQSVYSWRDRYAAAGIDGLREVSRRPRTSPSRLAAEVEALVCELRRAHPRWGARRIAFEVTQRGTVRAPSRATVHRVLERNGLVVPQAQRHKRKYKRWARETPMALWQLDLVGGVYLADGRECKMLSGIDDHSRFVVCAAVLAIPSGRAVADAFTAAMKSYGVPSEVLTDNGKQFTGRFTRPRPAEVLFERVCREHGITAKLTGPYSPTTTGKVERWHRTLRRKLLDEAGPFADLPSAQAAITTWVHAYNHARPHQALDMATPASLFRPGVSLDREPAAAALRRQAQAVTPARGPVPRLVLSPPGQAVEFETMISPAGVLSVLPRVQRLKLGPAAAGQAARVWADEVTVHVSIGGQLSRRRRPAWTPRTWPSCGCAARPRPGRRPRCPPPPGRPCPRAP
jgi:transposase InsO family protein